MAKAIQIEAEYFHNNRERMRYADFQKKNLFLGSGVIEAGCKPLLFRAPTQDLLAPDVCLTGQAADKFYLATSATQPIPAK